jgi:DNA (cytosine-5)-methyltransferase 1
VALGPLGWKAAWLSEIAPFPNAVLAHHYPDIPNLGDVTRLHETEEFQRRPIDLLVGGTPCRSFTITGLQRGLDDPDGRLALDFLRLAGLRRPRWVVWENVPGVLSTHGGRDFATIVGTLEKFGYGWTYRVLDAQYFGVPQGRRRVIVVGHLGDWRPAAAVLFEHADGAGNPEGGPQDGAKAASDVALVPRRTSPLVASSGEVSRCLLAGGSLRKNPTSETFVVDLRSLGVRRLTPLEWERLQGFPDAYTLIPWRNGLAPDDIRCKALGNSFAVPVLRWVGERIATFEEIRAKLWGKEGAMPETKVEPLRRLESHTLDYLQARTVRTWRESERSKKEYWEELGGLFFAVNKKMTPEGNGRKGMGFRAWLEENGIPSSTAYLILTDYMLAHGLKKAVGVKTRKRKRTFSKNGQGSAVPANPVPGTPKQMKETLATFLERMDASVRSNVARHLLEWIDDNYYGGEYRHSAGKESAAQEPEAHTRNEKAAA